MHMELHCFPGTTTATLFLRETPGQVLGTAAPSGSRPPLQTPLLPQETAPGHSLDRERKIVDHKGGGLFRILCALQIDLDLSPGVLVEIESDLHVTQGVVEVGKATQGLQHRTAAAPD